MKKILFISSLYPNPLSTGIAPFNRQQICGLSNHYHVDVISPVPWVGKNDRIKGEVSGEGKGVRCFYPTFYYPPKFARHLHGTFYYYSIIKTAQKLIKNNDYELIFSSWLFPDVWASQRIANKFKLPFFAKVHGTDVNRLSKGMSFTNKCLSSLDSSAGVFCVSQALKDKLIDFGCDPSSLHVVYNGIDKDLFKLQDKPFLRKSLGIALASKVILYVGRLEKEKGIIELIEAFRDIPDKDAIDLKLCIVGDGSCATEVTSFVVKNHLSDRVMFKGFLPLDAVASWMNASDVLCLPSYMEGVPNVVLEALACGTNVVTTNVGGIPEIAAQDDRVELVEPRDANALLGGLMKSLNSDGTNSKKISLCSWEQNAVQLIDVFESG